MIKGLFKLSKDERFIKRWEKTRQMGKHKYALFYGLLMGTIPIVSTFIGIVINGRAIPVPEDWFYAQFIDSLIIKTVIALVFGIFGSYSNWEMYEHNYRDLKAE